MNISFNYTLALYIVQLEVKPVPSLMVSGWFGVTVGNLLSALPLTLQHQMALSNTFIHSFPSQRILRWRGNNIQTTESCKRRSVGEHSVLGKNFRLHSRAFKRVCMEDLLREDGLLTGLVNKYEVLKTFLW